MDLSDTEQQALACIRWLRTPAGQAAIRQAVQKSAAQCQELREARRVDPDTLREPITE
jgi:hypothetical protein